MTNSFIQKTPGLITLTIRGTRGVKGLVEVRQTAAKETIRLANHEDQRQKAKVVEAVVLMEPTSHVRLGGVHTMFAETGYTLVSAENVYREPGKPPVVKITFKRNDLVVDGDQLPEIEPNLFAMLDYGYFADFKWYANPHDAMGRVDGAVCTYTDGPKDRTAETGDQGKVLSLVDTLPQLTDLTPDRAERKQAKEDAKFAAKVGRKQGGSQPEADAHDSTPVRTSAPVTQSFGDLLKQKLGS